MSGEVTLVGKAGGIGHGDNGMAFGEESTGVADAHLSQVGMRGKAQLMLKDPNQVEGAEIGCGGELLKRWVVGVMGFQIVAGPSHRLMLTRHRTHGRCRVSMATDELG